MKANIHLRPFRFFVLLCLLASMALRYAPRAKADQTVYGSIDWIFLLDTSESMSGKGGSANIFPDLRRTMVQFIQTTTIGDSVTIYTFDSKVNTKVTGESSWSILTQSDKDGLTNIVDNLKALGLKTHTGEAMQEALKRQRELAASQDKSRATVIILLTDGIEDISDNPRALKLGDVPIPPKEIRPYAIFVWLGKNKRDFENSPLNKVKEKFGDKGIALIYPEAKDIQKLGDDVRDKLPLVLKASPVKLLFNNIEPGHISETKSVSIQSTKPINIRLGLAGAQDRSVSLIEADSIALKPGANDVPISLKVAEDVRDGHYQRMLQVIIDEAVLDTTKSNSREVQALDAVEIELDVTYVPRWYKVLKVVLIVAGILASVFAVAILYLCIREQELPLELYRRWRRRKYLIGAIEVIKPRELSTRIQLSALKSEKVRISSLAGLAAYLDGADAELLLIRQNGDKYVRLCHSEGIVKVDGITLSSLAPTVDLYDNDKIELGDVQLNYEGKPRPELSD